MSRKNDKSKVSLNGFCDFHSETGTEGGYWAFQEARYIIGKTWDYKGLHILKNGDRLTIYAKDEQNKIVWEGIVKLRQHPLFTEDAFGFWIHADQEGVDRKTWARWFFDEHPAALIVA